MRRQSAAATAISRLQCRLTLPSFSVQEQMRNLSLVMIIALAFVANASGADSAATKYTCVMHPEVVMDAPGECPKCGMTLVPVKTEEKRPASNEQKKKAAHDENKLVEKDAKRVQADHEPQPHEM